MIAPDKMRELTAPLMRMDVVAYYAETAIEAEVAGVDVDALLRRQLLPFWLAKYTARLSWWQRVKFWLRLMLWTGEGRGLH